MNTTTVTHATTNAATLLWTWLQGQWAARTQQAAQGASDPAEAAALEAAREAAAVRRLADTYRRSDPGFASDLYAAADRYERAFDASREAASARAV
jgi:hypothetical protein